MGVYVGEEKVVDLWGSASIPTYSADTLTNVFSSTKSLTAIAMAVMQDRGLIKYGAKIAEYWPEFGQHGKGDLTVADLMRHEAGLVAWDTSLGVTDTLIENIKNNDIGKIIETQKQADPVTGKREYHGMTRGWIANEIFRRAHPEGETIGEFLDKELHTPLKADVYVGIKDASVKNYAPVTNMSFSFVFGQSMIPDMVGRGVDINIFQLLGFLNTWRKAIAKSGNRKPAFADYDGLSQEKQIDKFFNQETVRRGESPSANGNCSARGLAVIAAAMANKGNFKGKTILSPAAWDALHADPTVGYLFADYICVLTQGGVGKFGEPDVSKFEDADRTFTSGRDGFYGWVGYGGSVFQWHPEHKVGFAYTPTLMEWYSINNGKGAKLQQEVINCIENMKNKK